MHKAFYLSLSLQSVCWWSPVGRAKLCTFGYQVVAYDAVVDAEGGGELAD